MELDEIKASLARELKHNRYKHSLGVMESAAILAKRYGVSEEKAVLAGLLHDCARIYTDKELLEKAAAENIAADAVETASPALLHAKVGAVLAEKKFGIKDAEISAAIRLHTTGGINMTKLDKIIYLADMIEPNRDFPEVDALRKIAKKDLDEAVLMALEQSIRFIMAKGQLIHIDTVMARNDLLRKRQQHG
jgi:predicted HD superfamily hydrolase involved in NAD metabolism